MSYYTECDDDLRPKVVRVVGAKAAEAKRTGPQSWEVRFDGGDGVVVLMFDIDQRTLEMTCDTDEAPG